VPVVVLAASSCEAAREITQPRNPACTSVLIQLSLKYPALHRGSPCPAPATSSSSTCRSTMVDWITRRTKETSSIRFIYMRSVRRPISLVFYVRFPGYLARRADGESGHWSTQGSPVRRCARLNLRVDGGFSLTRARARPVDFDSVVVVACSISG
jgi:hypothetical protein